MTDSENMDKAKTQFLNGLRLFEIGQYDEAERAFETSLEFVPDRNSTRLNLALVQAKLKKNEKALVQADWIYDHLKSDPSALLQLAAIYFDIGEYDRSLQCIELAETRNLISESLLLCRGNIHKIRKQYQLAIQYYDQALILNTKSADAWINKAIIYLEQSEIENANTAASAALQINPHNAGSLINIGIVRKLQNKTAEAETFFNQAIQSSPRNAKACNNLAVIYYETSRYDEALAYFKTALEIDPDYVEAHSNLGNVHLALGQFSDAEKQYETAIALDPSYVLAISNLGNLYLKQHRYTDALKCFEIGISLEPENAKLHFDLGNLRLEKSQPRLAIASFNEAIRINPEYAQAYANRGSAYDLQISTADAIRDYETALQLDPAVENVFGALFYAKLKICDWTNYAAMHDNLIKQFNENSSATIGPFSLLGLVDDPAMQLENSRRYSKKILGVDKPRILKPNPARKKINIAYYSSDFRQHPMSYLMAELFELHDREQFHVTAFAFGPPSDQPIRKRIELGVDRFVMVDRLSDDDIIKTSIDYGIDIAINLNGYTKGERSTLFANRCAPIQVSYLGYPGTMGLQGMDYIIADSTIIPPGYEQYIDEKIAFMPHTYVVNDRKREKAKGTSSRRDHGLPESGFVYCCFNNTYKIQPDIFNSWMTILRAVPDSILWLLSDEPAVKENLAKEAFSRGINPARIVYAPFTSDLSYHFERLYHSDLFLDTLLYNAHTTASDSLWNGVPVLTCPGASFPSRVASSLLNAIDLPELIVESLDAYQNLAIELGMNSKMHALIKEKLRRNILTTPLFDSPKFTQHIESAYLHMIMRLDSGLEPDTFYVSK